MQYALVLYRESDAEQALSESEREAAEAEYAELVRDVRLVQAARLQPAEMATTVRVADGRTLVTDGPFADTKEVLGGIAVIEADNLDEAIEIAERIPAARHGGVEIRPLAQP